MAHPVFTEHITPEIIEVFIGARASVRKTKRMRARAQRDDGYAPRDSRREALHSLIWPLAETQREDETVGVVEHLGAGNAFVVVGIDRSVGIEGKEHRTFKPEALAKNLSEHGQAFLAAIFFIAGKKDQVPALAEAGFRWIGDGSRRGARNRGDRGNDATKDDE